MCEESQAAIEGTPEREICVPGGEATPPHMLTATPSSSAPPVYAAAPSLMLRGDYGPDAEDPIILYLTQVHRCANDAAAAYKSSRKRNRTHFECTVQDNVALTEQLRKTKDEVADLERICESLQEESGAAHALRMQLDEQKERIREAGMLEEQNAKLASSILGLRKELANGEKAVKELHNEMTTVAETHAKKLRIILGQPE